jgi:hypothetical protein
VVAARFYLRDNVPVGLQGAGQLGEGGKRTSCMQAVYFFQEAVVYSGLVEWGWHVQREGEECDRAKLGLHALTSVSKTLRQFMKRLLYKAIKTIGSYNSNN